MKAFFETLVLFVGLGIGLLLFSVTCGCGGPAEEMRKAVKSGAEFSVVAEPLLIAFYQAQQDACLKQEEPKVCIEKVRSLWTPVFEKYETARSAWCAVDKAIGQGKCP